MNMNNPLVKSLMGRLQGIDPQSYAIANQLMQSGGNPDAILKQMMGNLNPEQKQQILNTAKGYGAPENILAKIQNMK